MNSEKLFPQMRVAENGTSLVDAIRSRSLGKPFDSELLCNSVDSIIWGVYWRRYEHLIPILLSEERMILPEYAKEKLHEVVGSKLPDGTMVVDFKAFQNECWDRIEGILNGGLSFPNDAALKSHLKKTCENFLQERIYDLTPFLQTRKKQIDDILKHFTMDKCKKECSCWRLKEAGTENCLPEVPERLCKECQGRKNWDLVADLKRLRNESMSLKAPKMKYPKKADPEKGPSIGKREMEKYLLALLRSVGGMTHTSALLTFIGWLYGLTPVKAISPILASTEDGEEVDALENIGLSALQSDAELLLSAEHYTMARELLNAIRDELRIVYSYYFCLEKTLEEIARLTQYATTTIHNRVKEINNLVTKQLGRQRVSPAEAKAVQQIICEMLLQE